MSLHLIRNLIRVFTKIPEVKCLINNIGPEDKLKLKGLGGSSKDIFITNNKATNSHQANPKILKKTFTFNSGDKQLKDNIKFLIPKPNKGDIPTPVEEKEEENSPSQYSPGPEKNFDKKDSNPKFNEIQQEIKYGDIKILEKLGQGSFGVVEKAVYIPLNINIALKVIFNRKFHILLMRKSKNK